MPPPCCPALLASSLAMLVGCSDSPPSAPSAPAREPAPAPRAEEPRVESDWLDMPFLCRTGSSDWASCRFERRDEGYALSFGRSGLRCDAVDFDHGGKPVTLRGCGAEAQHGITVPATISLTESVWGILEGGTTGWTCAREPCHPGVFLKKTWPAGPFASVEAYCADFLERCARAGTFEGDCECRLARNAPIDGEPADLHGPTERSTPNLALQHAALLRVARGVTEPVACELALRTRRGVFVLQRASRCGAVRSIGSDGYSIATRLLETWLDEDGAALLLDWEETATFGGRRTSERLRIRCSVDESGIPRCPWRELRGSPLDDLEHAPERWREVPGARRFVHRNARTVILEARQSGGGLACSSTTCGEALDVWPLRGTLPAAPVGHYLGSNPPPESGCWDDRLFADWTAIEIAPVVGRVAPHCGVEIGGAQSSQRWVILRVHLGAESRSGT